MIQSSVLIQGLLTAVRALENWYKHSSLHGFFAAVGGAIKRQWRASATRNMLDGAEAAFAGTLFFRILRFFYRLFNTIAHWVRIRLANAVSGSVGFDIADSYRAWDSAFKTTGMISVGFGLSVLILSLLHRSLWGISGLFFLLAGLFMYRIAGDIDEIAKSSYALKGFRHLWRLLLHDKEVASWKRA